MDTALRDAVGPRYDAFVSYRQLEPVMSWVRDRLVPRLEDDDLSVCVDYRDFRPGVPVITEMGRAVEASAHTVAVMTPVYLSSAFTELEVVMAQQFGLEERRWILVPVMREPVRTPLHLRSLLWIDMTDDDRFEISSGRLCRHLHQPPAPTAGGSAGGRGDR